MNSPVGGAAHPTEVARKAGIALAGRIGYAILSYVALVLAARILGPDDFGIYALGLTLVAFLSTLGAMGTDNTLLRLIPRRVQEVDGGGVRAVMRTATLLSIGTGSLAALALFAVEGTLVDRLGPGARVLPLIGLAIPLASYLYVPRAAAQSIHAVRLAVVNGFLLQAASLLVGMSVALMTGRRAPTLMAWLYVTSWAISCVVLTVRLGRRREFGYSWLWPGGAYDAEVRELAPRFLLIQLLINLKSTLIVFILGALLEPAEIGLYSAAVRTAALVSFILIGINMAFAPVISDLWARGEHEQLHRLYRITSRWSLAVSLPACLVLALAPGTILGTFDPSFQSGGAVLVWLACGQLINAATGSVGYLLMMSGREREVTVNSAAATLISGVLTWFTARVYGVVGAAVVGGVVVSLFNLGLLWSVWRNLRMRPFDLQTLRVAAPGLLAAVAGLSLRGALTSAGHPPWRIASGAIGSALLVYVIAFLFLNRSPEDYALIRGVLARRRSKV